MVYKINDSYYLTYGDRAKDRRHKTWCKHYSKGKCMLRGGVDCNSSTLCVQYEELENHEVKSNNSAAKASQNVRYYNIDNGIKIYTILSYTTGDVKDYYISNQDKSIIDAFKLSEDCEISKKVVKLDSGTEFDINGYRYKLISINIRV